MSKRQGGELNHINWDQAEEPEEAGLFRQASTGDLKARVIKTARRRRPLAGDTAATGEAKNAFSAFGGFSKTPSSSVDATATFSFIGKSAAATEEKTAPAAASGGFVFGNSAPTKTAEKSGLFSFGGFSSTSSPKVTFGTTQPENGSQTSTGEAEVTKDTNASTSDQKPEATGFKAFSFGAKPAADAAKEKSPPPAFGAGVGFSLGACTTPSPAAGFSFGAAAASTKLDENKENNTAAFTFGSKSPEKKWPLAEGLEGRGTKIDPCVTESASLGTKPAGDSGFPLPFVCGGSYESVNAKISFGAVSTEQSKTDNDKTKKDEKFSFGSNTINDSKPMKPFADPFSFGAKSPEEKTWKPSAEPFSFGTKQEDTKINFSFGGGLKTDTEVKKPSATFSFGSEKKDDVNQSNSFLNFAAKSQNDSVEPVSKLSPDKPSGFVFGSGSNSSSPQVAANNASKKLTHFPGSSPTNTPGTGQQPSKDYLAHLKALNTQVASWINSHLDRNPLVLLSPVFKDYEKHLADITRKYQTERSSELSAASRTSAPPSITTSLGTVPLSTTPSLGTVPPSTTPSLGAAMFAPKTSITSDTSKPPAFGSLDKPGAVATPFSFGLSSSSSSSSSPAAAPAVGGAGGFSFSMSTTNSTTLATTEAAVPAAAEQAEDEEDAPPVVELKQVVEDDAIYSKKCKLFYKKDGSYVEKGVGMLYLKPVEGGKVQLLVRADTNLGNVLLNILLSSQIPTTRVGKNNVMLVCVPNPPVDPKADTSAPCPMLIRVKDGDAADELKAKIDECKEK